MSVDRFTLEKIKNSKKSESWLQMTLLQNEFKMHVLDFYEVTFQCPFFFLLMPGSAAHLYNMT